ncbi:unnamed protein product, partial [Mesorhabditis belari]|uniref:SHSP domain-containing protein n=1 Tax=Mesorhabditis belari TaxID=2138241 RepID=A0AAF3ED07_9BILA
MMFTPYWRHVPFNRDFSFGESSGQVLNEIDRFSVALDVAHFRPDELKVNITGQELTIEGKHDERIDEYGSIQRMFIRKFNLPEDTNLDAIRSSITENGVLQIEAPKQGGQIGQTRSIPIEPTPRK